MIGNGSLHQGIIIVLPLLGYGLSVAAQDTLSDADIYSSEAFNQAVSESKATDSANRLEYLPGVFFVADGSAYRAHESQTSSSEARFYGKGFIKASQADIGALFLACNFNYFLYAAATDPAMASFYALQAPDPGVIRADLSEFHFSTDIKKRVFIRAGNQLIKWGASYFWTPVDFINRQKEQAAILSVVDRRAGKPGVRLHVPIGSMNLFYFGDLSRVAIGGTPLKLAEATGHAWHFDGVWAGVQLGVSGYVTPGLPEQLGFDATGRLAGTDLYGECALTFVNAIESAPEVALSAGGSRLFGRERNWTLRAEGYYNHQGYGDTAISRLLPGSFNPFYSGKYYAYAELSGVNLIRTTTAVSLFGFANLADGSFSTTLQVTVDLPGVLPFTLYGRYYGGREDREFTQAFGGQATGGGVRIRADF
jgi:hypothetical protein